MLFRDYISIDYIRIGKHLICQKHIQFLFVFVGTIITFFVFNIYKSVRALHGRSVSYYVSICDENISFQDLLLSSYLQECKAMIFKFFFAVRPPRCCRSQRFGW